VTLALVKSSRGTPVSRRRQTSARFEYSPFVRPADDELGHLSTASPADKQQLLTALSPWQSFHITNTTGADFDITNIDKSAVASPGDHFVTVVDSSLQPPTYPISVPKVLRSTSYAFYDPAIRVGDQVTEQFPDWTEHALTSAFGGRGRPTKLSRSRSTATRSRT